MPAVEKQLLLRGLRMAQQLRRYLPQRGSDLAQIQRLFYIAGGPQPDGALQVFLVGIAAQKNELARGQKFPHGGRHFQPVAPRHFDVADDDLGAEPARLLHGFLAVGGQMYLRYGKFLPRDMLFQNGARHRLVVGNQNGKAHGIHLLPGFVVSIIYKMRQLFK